MTRRKSAALLGVAAVGAAGIDLAQKAWAVSEAATEPVYHDRPLFFVALVAALSAVEAFAAIHIRSRSICVAAGVLVGAGVGNAASLILWQRGIPNSLLFETSAAAVSYNLADLFSALGLLGLVIATCIYGLRNRDRLHQPLSA